MLTLEARLENWALCHRWRVNVALAINQPKGRNPVERRYFAKERGFYTSSPQHWEAVPTPMPDPDQKDADKVEQAVCKLPLYHHLILKYHYIHAYEPPIVLRKAARGSGMRQEAISHYQRILSSAKSLLCPLLSLPAYVVAA